MNKELVEILLRIEDFLEEHALEQMVFHTKEDEDGCYLSIKAQILRSNDDE